MWILWYLLFVRVCYGNRSDGRLEFIVSNWNEAKVKDFVELRHVIIIILRRWWVLIAVPIIAITAGYLISIKQPSVYQATTTILIGQTIQSADVNRTDIQTSE